MMGALLGVVLAGVVKAFWSWQGKRIKGWGGKAKEAVKGCRDRVRDRAGRRWQSFIARILFWCERLRIFKQNNL